MLFKTTNEQRAKIPTIKEAMINDDVNHALLTLACGLAQTDQGIFDLMDMWYECPDQDRYDILKDLESCVKDYVGT